jgi:very-short-patch-repair endonuclease
MTNFDHEAQRDKERDRYLQSRGLTVFHLTGSEIWNDPRETADNVIEDCYLTLASRHRTSNGGNQL